MEISKLWTSCGYDMKISKDRLREDLLKNGSFGETGSSEGYGRTLLTGSEADKKARENFTRIIKSLGLDIKIDPVGNIAGYWVPDTADPSADPVTMGSHLDSVPNGGIFDGALGVFAGVETIRAIQESAHSPTRPIQVVSFTEEEGSRFGLGLLGSSVVGGQREEDRVLSLEDDDGVTVQQALDNIGFSGTDRLSPSGWKSWLELHIEQGTVLDNAGISTGVVTAITGISNCKVEIVGEANHAGSTLMEERTDALVAASVFVEQVERIAKDLSYNDSEFVAATVGEMEIEPNARNIIPGKVSLSIDIRDTDTCIIEDVINQMKNTLSRIEDEKDVNISFNTYRSTKPVPMGERSQNVLINASEKCGIETMKLPSGGGHDTRNIKNKTEVGLLFVRSKDGISHSPNEWTSWDDCKKATQILANSVVNLTCNN
jgi:N-carbamoyl-L-amino-acid hydrolase